MHLGKEEDTVAARLEFVKHDLEERKFSAGFDKTLVRICCGEIRRLDILIDQIRVLDRPKIPEFHGSLEKRICSLPQLHQHIAQIALSDLVCCSVAFQHPVEEFKVVF